MPDDLRAELDARPGRAELFAGLDSRNRYAILYRIGDAKRPETRARRIAKFVAMLNEGETLYPPGYNAVGQAEAAERLGREERGDLADPRAAQREHVDAVRHEAAARLVPEVVAERELPVRAHREEAPAACRPRAATRAGTRRRHRGRGTTSPSAASRSGASSVSIETTASTSPRSHAST